MLDVSAASVSLPNCLRKCKGEHIEQEAEAEKWNAQVEDTKATKDLNGTMGKYVC